MDDGRVVDFLPGERYDIPAGDGGSVIGDDLTVRLEMSIQIGVCGQPQSGVRVLATLLLTDNVGSTPLAQRLGDEAWTRLLAAQ